MNTPTGAAPAAARTQEAWTRAVGLLTDRYAEGVLDDAALDRRLQRLHAAEDAAAIDAVVADLADVPARATASPAIFERPWAVPLQRTQRRILALMSETKRSGRWIVPDELRVIAIMSDVKLDLRHAMLPPLSVVDVTAWMASVHLIVPPGVAVLFEAYGVMGVAKSGAIEPDDAPHRPVVRVVGGAVMGEVKVIVKEAAAR